MEEKKKINSSFTIRAWSQKIGFKSHNALYEAVKGKRPIPKKYLHKIGETLKHNQKECFYFETLVDLSRTKDPEERVVYLNRLERLRGGRLLDFDHVKDFKVLKDPLCGCLLEMAYMKPLIADPKKIKECLRFERSIREIDAAIKLLVSAGLLLKSKGMLIKSKRRLMSTENVQEDALVCFHKELSSIAIDQIEVQDVKKRDFRGTILNIDPEKVDEARTVLQEFMSDFINEFEISPNDKKRSQIFCIHTKLFSLTKDF